MARIEHQTFVATPSPDLRSSVGESQTSFKVGQQPEFWMRARMLGDPSEALLFDQINPQDIRDSAEVGRA